MIKGIASIKPGIEERRLLQTDTVRGIQQSHSALNCASYAHMPSVLIVILFYHQGFLLMHGQECFKVYAHFHTQEKSDKQLYVCGTIK